MLHTPLNEWHVAHGGRMVDFAGWYMPVQYTSVVEEHLATRRAVGITDVSHMGRLLFEGPGACRFLDSLLTRDVAALKPGQVRYSLIANEHGGIHDDVLIGFFPLPDGSPCYFLVVNASNREKILALLAEQTTEAGRLGEGGGENSDGEYRFVDRTVSTGMVAIQGPRAVEVVQRFADVDVAKIKYYHGLSLRLRPPFDVEVLLTRTGYTGEDGFEITLPAERTTLLWETLHEKGAPLGLLPVGLGARDTLRLEAGMPLYGHELGEEINPFEAGLSYACHLDGADFRGRDALRRLAEIPPRRCRVGIELDGKRPAREGCPILSDAQDVPASRRIGIVTSGTFAPLLEKPIAQGFVETEFSSPGQLVTIDIRGKIATGRVVPLPFYQRKK